MNGVMLDVKSIDRDDLDFSSIKSIVPEWQFYDVTADNEVLERIQNVDIVVTNKVKVTKEHLGSVSGVRLICVAATGTNNVDLEAAAAAGIPVVNITNYATASVVQHVFCLILSLLTRLEDYRNAVRDQQWHKSPFFCLLDYPISELSGKTMGIIGYGVLGKAVAQVAKAFGMKVQIAARRGEAPTGDRVSFRQMMEQSDVVSIHCPLTDDTRNLVDRDELALMKQSAIIINTARGGIINEHALADALRAGRIAGAGVDVLSEEPPVNGNVLLDLKQHNLIVTPHIAWASVESRQRALEEIALNIDAFLKGEERNRVC